MEKDKLFPQPSNFLFPGIQGAANGNVSMYLQQLAFGQNGSTSQVNALGNHTPTAPIMQNNTNWPTVDQSNSWIEQAKMLPMYNMLSGNVGTSKGFEPPAQQNRMSHNRQTQQSLMQNPAMQSMHQGAIQRQSPIVNSQNSNSPATPSGRMSNNPSSHHSAASPATSLDGLHHSNPSSQQQQQQPYDLTVQHPTPRQPQHLQQGQSAAQSLSHSSFLQPTPIFPSSRGSSFNSSSSFLPLTTSSFPSASSFLPNLGGNLSSLLGDIQNNHQGSQQNLFHGIGLGTHLGQDGVQSQVQPQTSQHLAHFTPQPIPQTNHQQSNHVQHDVTGIPVKNGSTPHLQQQTPRLSHITHQLSHHPQDLRHLQQMAQSQHGAHTPAVSQAQQLQQPMQHIVNPLPQQMMQQSLPSTSQPSTNHSIHLHVPQPSTSHANHVSSDHSQEQKDRSYDFDDSGEFIGENDVDGMDLFSDFNITQEQKDALHTDEVNKMMDMDIFGHDVHNASTSTHADDSMEKPPEPKPTEVRIEAPESKLERLLSSMRQHHTHAPPARPQPSMGNPLAGYGNNAVMGSSAQSATISNLMVPGTSKQGVSPTTFTPPQSPTHAGSSSQNHHGPSSSSSSHRHLSMDAFSSIPSTSSALFKQINEPFLSPTGGAMTPTSAYSRVATSSFKARRVSAPRPSTIPIWKQKKNEDGDKRGNDAFNFTDDEMEEIVDKKKEAVFEEDEDDEPDGSPPPSAPSASAPKYIPRVGFDVKKDEDKDAKRDTRRYIPPLPIPQEAQTSHQRPVKSETVEFTERIKQRMCLRTSKEFMRSEEAEDDTCAKEEKAVDLTDAEKPPLPRILIRIPKMKSIDESEKKKRRRKADESDDEWYGSDRHRGVKKKRGRKPKHEKNAEETYSVRLVDPTTLEQHRKGDEGEVNGEYYNKKKRFLKHWKDRENDEDGQEDTLTNGVTEGKIELKPVSRVISDFKSPAVRARLAKFKPCTGNVPKGTFMVVKTDVFKPDCALWRVDNQNLLQKFPGKKDPEDPDRITYKNSSTYSGWCEQIASSYIIVTVKYIRQSRSDTVVEPEVPIADLLPAMADDCQDNFTGLIKRPMLAKEEVSAQNDARVHIVRDPLRTVLSTYIKYMLDNERALAFDFFKQTNDERQGLIDWNNMHAVSEVEQVLSNCSEKIRARVRWTERHDNLLRRYSRCTMGESDAGSLLCQACNMKNVERVMQLFRRSDYNPTTLEMDAEVKKELIEEEGEEEELLPAVETLLCGSCGRNSQWMHRLLHFKFDLVQRIEERMSEVAAEAPSLTPEQIIDQLRQSYIWLKEIICDVTEFWKTVLASSE